MPLPIRKEVKKLKGYHLEKQYERIKLNQNESPSDISDELKRIILRRLESAAWNRYPTPFCDPLREMIAQKNGVSLDSVVVTGGSNILIQALMMATAINHKVMTVSPSFSLYGIEASLLGNRLIQVPLKKEDFSLPLDLFLRTLRKAKPKLIILPNPNAPTGNLFDQEDLLKILAQAEKVGALLVIDEAYYPFSKTTMAPFLKKSKHLVILRTLSKAYSLGGVRLGYLLADPEVAGEVIKVILPFSVGILSQIVGEVVMENDGFVASLVEAIIKERDRIYLELKSISDLTVYPSMANYVLFQSPKSQMIFEKLSKAGVLIRNVSGPRLPNALRVSVGTMAENQVFLDEMKKFG